MAGPGIGAAAPRLSLLLLLVVVFAGSSLHSRTEAAVRTCTYTVKVKTSCASPARTSDAVSVAFGDAYRNEAYGARLPSAPGGRAFERCGTDTFRVSGVCGYGVCYLYLRRAGRDGWAPEWVQVTEPGPGAGEKPATFYFGAPLPDGVWYGHNRCPKAKAKAKAAAAARTNTTSAVASPLG
ncbi:embryo-specific protein ATS3A-like [Triticum dicoccoides]|uniref:embryo-specific protein ATS3A-like n=1 Tax=Triticum dicoccoides TaxID=85692 RepID=UPI000E7B5E1B|nr:embryo-specific protein ATS3A-like [Triticum dicoccoides]